MALGESIHVSDFKPLISHWTISSQCHGISPMVRWLRLQASTAGGTGLSPSQGTKTPSGMQRDKTTTTETKSTQCWGRGGHRALSVLLLLLPYYCGCCSVGRSCPTLCDPMASARQASLSSTISLSLLKLLSIKSVMPSNHLVLCRLSPPTFNLAHQGLCQ